MNNKKAEERHREQLEFQEKQHERDEERAEQLRQEREEYEMRQQEIAEELADEIREAAYKQHNPGDYKCPSCLYVTLRANSARCPSCRADVPTSYWDQIRKNELAAAKQKAEEESRKKSEEARTAPLREAESLITLLRSTKISKQKNWRKIFKAFLALFLFIISFSVLAKYREELGAYFENLEGVLFIVAAILYIVLHIVALLSIIAVPALLIYLIPGSLSFLLKVSALNSEAYKNALKLKKLRETNVVKNANLSNEDTSIVPEVLSGLIILIVTGSLAVWLFFSWATSLTPEEFQDTISDQNKHTQSSLAAHHFDSTTHLSGERFPFTRLNLLSSTDSITLNLSDTQYAINEIFARHGAWFPNEKLRNHFMQFLWYKPDNNLSFDEIEKKFSHIEAHNLKSLAAHRDRLRREQTSKPQSR